MHLNWFCTLQHKVDAGREKLRGRKDVASRRALLLDEHPHAASKQARASKCRDPRHRNVPLANTPPWARGPLAPPSFVRVAAAGRHVVVLPQELWGLVRDALGGAPDDLTALRQTSKFFARLVDERASLLFGRHVWREVMARRLDAPPLACARSLFADIERLQWRVDGRKDERALASLLVRLPRLRVLEVYGGADHSVALPNVPLSVRELTLSFVYTTDASAWVNHLPRALQRLTLCGLDGPLQPHLAWPPALQALSLQDCAVVSDESYDFHRLTALRELEISGRHVPAGDSLRLTPAHALHQHQRQTSGGVQQTNAENFGLISDRPAAGSSALLQQTSEVAGWLSTLHAQPARADEWHVMYDDGTVLARRFLPQENAW